MYYNYLLQANLFNEFWDNQAKVSQALGKNGLNTFLSSDNERSIAEKAKYIVDNDLGGAIIWEITGDYIETFPGSGVIANTPLVDTLNSVLCNYAGGGSSAGLNDNSMNNIQIYPNPAKSLFTIENKGLQHYYVVISHMNGAQVMESLEIESLTAYKLDLDLPSGTYLVNAIDKLGCQEFFRLVIDQLSRGSESSLF